MLAVAHTTRMDRTPPDDDPGGRSDAETETEPAETATDRDRTDRGDEIDAPSAARSASDDERGVRRGGRGTVDALLPEATVDSNWWYWIAAVPVYFLLVLGLGVGAAFLFLFAFALDVAGLAGLGSVVVTLVATVAFVGLGLVGLVVAVMFPVATYVDARAVERAELGGDWNPDPALYALLALAAVLVTNFVLSVPFAVYYLYRRHQHLGRP